ncbi:flagellar motor switch protein FliM [Oceanisphaera sp.]|uniref:flagellar motor switch protein FliM n=1 Tax=Oceanisphaera sp. TaxID=1929979 RepID=UPI003A92850A
MSDLLSQDEIDALLHGLEDIEEESAGGAEGNAGDDVTMFDFSSQERMVRGHMPALEVVNTHFARYMRSSLSNMMRRGTEVSVNGVKVIKFGEYVHSLFLPTSLNMVRFRPLKGVGLITLEARLVFLLVDNFFGGDGREAKMEGREFTPTERRVTQLLLKLIFEDYQEAWSPILDVGFEYLDSEVNPTMANIVSSTELVVVNSFHIELEGGGGELHVALPYAMLEPIRELLEAGVQSDQGESDVHWSRALRDEVLDVEVDMSVKLLEKPLTLRNIMEMEAGDIIPVDLPEHLLVSVEEMPSFRGQLGQTGDKMAVRITERIKQPKPVKNELEQLTRRGRRIGSDVELEALERTIEDAS